MKYFQTRTLTPFAIYCFVVRLGSVIYLGLIKFGVTTSGRWDQPTGKAFMSHITYLEAAVVGLIQGVTELFPVSSLGHNVLLPALIGGSWATT